VAKDIDLSADLMRAYKQTHHSSTDACDLSVNVLTTGHWPTFANQPVALPPELTRTLDRFRDFYASKHSGRALVWQHSLDQCTLRSRFGTSRKELSVSLYQALILLLFNDLADGETLSVEDITASTKLAGPDLTRTLQSLACGKIRILNKTPKGREIDPGDRFAVNEALKSDNFKLKINQIQQKETVEEQKTTTTRVLLERKLVLEAAIVRFMKARKTMSHTDLVMETVAQLKERCVRLLSLANGSASTSVQVQGRAERDQEGHRLAHRGKSSSLRSSASPLRLMQREYMERAETRGTYRYLVRRDSTSAPQCFA
jgi:cullin-4